MCKKGCTAIWFPGLGVFSCGMFRYYGLGTISSPKIISLLLLIPMFPCFFRNMYPFEQVSSGEINVKNSYHPMD